MWIFMYWFYSGWIRWFKWRSSETHVMTDAEIIAQVTLYQCGTSDVTEDDNSDEEEGVDW